MDHLFTIEGRLFTCRIERSRVHHKFSCLKVSVNDFCQHRKLFKKSHDVSIEIKQDIVQITRIHVKLDILTGFSTILLHTLTNNAGLVFLLDREFSACRLIAKLDNSPGSVQKNVYFIDGPGIIQNNFSRHTVCLKVGGKQKELVLKKAAVVTNVLWSGYCMELGVVAVFSCISKNEKTELFTFFVDGLTEEYKTVDSGIFIPGELQNLVTANVIHLSKSFSSETVTYHSEIITLTSDGFFIYLQEGRILWALPTCISNTKNLVLFSWEAYSLNSQFAAIYNNSSVIFINTKERKILDTVTDVAAVYQDDFVCCGQNQILCQLTGFSLESNSGWLLTDKGVWLFDQQAVNQESAENYQPAILALQRKLQNELIAFHNKSHTINKERSEFIMDTWNLLIHQNHYSKTKGALEPSKFQQISTGDIWQVVRDDKWLVGVDIVNNYDSPLCDLSLSLFPINKDGRQSENVIHTKSQWLVAEYPENRRSKFTRQGLSKAFKHTASLSELQPKETGVVVCETNLPNFFSHPEFSCEVMLTLNHSSDAGNVETGDENPQYRLQQSCGVVTLKAASLIGEEYSLEMMTKNTLRNIDHWCVEAVSLLTQVTCHLELRTTWSNASCLTDWIERLCEYQYSAGQKCYKTTLPAFSGLRLVIEPQTSHDRACIIVHSNSSKQILLLVHHLYGRLADDTVIFPRLGEDDDERLQAAIRAIRKEAERLKPIPKNAVRQRSGLGDIELPENDVDGAILVNNIRENFRKRKEAANCVKDSGESSENQQNLYLVQQCTDAAIAKLTL